MVGILLLSNKRADKLFIGPGRARPEVMRVVKIRDILLTFSPILCIDWDHTTYRTEVNMKRLLICASIAALLAACGGEQQQQSTELNYDAAISADEFLENIKFLASDELKGRGNGTPELNQAANVIAGNFEAAGLQPLGGSYLQSFEVQTGSSFGENNCAAFALPETSLELELLADYVPLSFNREAAENAPVVFAGYGISAEDKNYDDYAGLDVTGKVVLVLDLEPQRDNKESVFDGSADSSYATTQAKILTARLKGAAGIVIFRGPRHVGEEPVTLPETGPGFKVDEIGVNGVITTYETLKPVLDAAGLDIAAIQDDIDANLEPRSRELDEITASISIDVSPIMAEVYNVIGVLPGTDEELKDQYVVIGAHYDHLGLGYRGSMSPDLTGEVHNGADDNASGTSGVMELAEYFGAEENRTKRPLLFIAFAGEEWGLLGSAFFMESGLVPQENMAAMMNMDMIGRAQDGAVTVGGTGTAELFSQVVDEVSSKYNLNITAQDSGFASSDNASFTAKSIPALFFFTGTHGDYHKPSDDWDLINADDGAEILNMIADTTAGVANAEARPEYVKMKVDTSKMRTRGGGKRPWFGSMPDFGYQGDGYKFNMITEGSPAHEAGFQAGDIMVEFGGAPVMNIYDYTSALSMYQPGDEVEVKVLRDGEEFTSTVKLTRRPGK